MMRPTMEQLLEYVRGGETDSAVTEMLKHDPDAGAKLREARFICGMIGRQPTPDSDRPIGDAAGELAATFDMEVASRRAPESPRRPALLRSVEPSDGRRQISEVARNVRSYGPPGRDLGTVIATEGDKVYVLSHKPPRRPKEIEAERLAAAEEQIQIDWAENRIWLSQSIASDRPLKVRITRGKDDAPVEGVDVVFMPDSGAFQRTRTNERGFAKLVSVRDGIVRFADRDIGLLRVEGKKEN